MPRVSQGPRVRPNHARGGLYYIYWTEPGRTGTRQKPTGTRDSAAAHRQLAAFIDEQNARRAGEPWASPRRAAEARIEEVLALYAAGHAATKVVSKQTVGYGIRALLGFWGTLACDAIRPETCRSYVLYRTSQGVQPATAARELTVLRAALGWAHKNGKLLDRPFVELPPSPPGRNRWLTRTEAARLLWESRRYLGARDHLPMFIMLALRTGARPAALFDLKWTQIDFDRNVIDFNPPGRERTKKGRPVITIPRKLRWFLLRLHARAASPYVLAYRGKKLSSVKTAFAAARKRARLGPDVVPYTLRHTCGTWLAHARVPEWEIAGWLGHTESKTTELYKHHHPDHLAAARAAMDR